MERVELTDGDVTGIERLADDEWAGKALAELAPDQREAINAHVVRGRSYAEIAQIQHVSESAVRQRVSRGLASIRRRSGGPRT
jgi:RNA polymerase sigma-70 factor (ECF subfamily)